MELLHPVTVAIVIACAPVATIAVSGMVDYLSYRHDEHAAPGSDRVRDSGRHGGAKPAPQTKPAPDGAPALTRKG